jgi:hypothetical protein
MHQAELFPDLSSLEARVRRAPERTFGPTYRRELDALRIAGQMLRILLLMSDRAWRTLPEISERTGDPPASVSAQLRHLRKKRFGAYRVDKRPRAGSRGLWEYRVSPGEFGGEA